MRRSAASRRRAPRIRSTPTPDSGDPTVVAIDTPTMDVILTENFEVAPYEGFYERIREAALSPEDSANLLTKEADMLPDN